MHPAHEYDAAALRLGLDDKGCIAAGKPVTYAAEGPSHSDRNECARPMLAATLFCNYVHNQQSCNRAVAWTPQIAQQ
jgi:hypothetical protein